MNGIDGEIKTTEKKTNEPGCTGIVFNTGVDWGNKQEIVIELRGGARVKTEMIYGRISRVCIEVGH